MKNLGEEIAQRILEEINSKVRTIAIYPGAFKPPHKGHLEVVQLALSKADEVLVLVSKADRDGVQVGQSLKIWEMLLKTIGADASRVKIQVSKSESPVKDVYNIVKEFPNVKFIALFGKGEFKRFEALSKYPNVEILDTGTLPRKFESISATNLRSAIKNDDMGKISEFYPQEINAQEIMNIIPSENILTEGKNNRTVAMIGGATKPPTAGHFLFAKTALENLPDIDSLVINVGTQARDGVNQEQAMRIWEIYKKHLSDKVEIRKMTNYTPIRYVYAYAKQHPDENVILAIGTREGEEQDLIDYASRTAKLDKDKYPNLSAIDIRTVGGNSGTKARAAMLVGDKEEFLKYVPKELSDDEKNQIWNIVNDKSIKENKEQLNELSNKELKFWALFYDIFQKLNKPNFVEIYKEIKPTLDGEKLEALNYFFKIFNDADSVKNLLENKANKSVFKKYINYINEVLEYCCEDLKIPKPEIEIIINNDSFSQEHKSFGAYFPGQNKINLVIKNRNLSDVCRTLSHELKHAEQDYNGRLKEGAGKDGDIFENEANSYSGKIMREFNRKYPEILKLVNNG